MRTGVMIVGVVALGGLAAAAYYFTHRKSAAQVSGGGPAQQYLPARRYAQNHGVNQTATPPVTLVRQILPAIVETLPSVQAALANAGSADTFTPDVQPTVTDTAGGTTTYFGS
jgi:hypothetical protein